MKNFPKFGIGTLHFGSFIGKRGCKEIVCKALDFGVNFFDTSPLYGNSLSEETLGEIFSEICQPVFVSTKVGLQVALRKDRSFGVEVMKLTQKNLRDSVEKSLKKLRVESIDLLMLHAFDPETPLSEIVSTLIQLHQEGKIQYFGCSNYNPKQLQALLRESKKKSCSFFLAAQCHYNMIERRAGRYFIPICESNDLRVIVNRALARGALSGQYTTSESYPEDSRAARSVRLRKWLQPHRLNLLEAFSRLSSEKGLSLASVALAWLKMKYPNSVPLLGARNVEQLNQCLKSSEMQLDDTFFKEIETIVNKDANVYGSPPRYLEK